MSFFLKDWRQIELRATVLIVVENAPPPCNCSNGFSRWFMRQLLLVSMLLMKKRSEGSDYV